MHVPVLVNIAIVALALVGHGALWVGIINRWHSTGYRRIVVKLLTLIPYAAILGLPWVVAWPLISNLAGDSGSSARPFGWDAARYYVLFVAAFGACHLPIWALRRWRAGRLPSHVRTLAQRVVDMEQLAGMPLARGPRATSFCRIPGNQIWQLEINEFEVQVPRLPKALDGISICHWSDLHFSGRIDRAYFDEVVRLTNELNVDLIALTGDVCDKVKCIDWIDSLAPARCRLGKYFILGNHDLRTHDLSRLRTRLSTAGFVDVGNRSQLIHDGQILIAGNERPWICPPVNEPMRVAPADRALRLLLSHAPDQLAWARREKFDVMLAGHTHGGQICFPLIGPTICPIAYGVKYASGFFDCAPTLLHVSRGTCGLMPLRINCPPEITKLILRAAG